MGNASPTGSPPNPPSPSKLSSRPSDSTESARSSQNFASDAAVWDLPPNPACSRGTTRRRLSMRSESIVSLQSSSFSLPSVNPASLVSLAQFQVLKFLGRGSYGKVYLVMHIESNRLMALKTMRKAAVLERSRRDHAMTELRVLARLATAKSTCPFICPLFYAFHSPSKLFLAQEYLGGGELYYHLCKRGKMPEALARFYASELCLALGYLHSMAICYRDLKPENIVLDLKGHAHLVDMGLCVEGVSAAFSHGRFARGGGTTDYCAPEVLDNLPTQGLAGDWWAFGMLVYEMLTGLPPWHDADKARVVLKIKSAPVEELDWRLLSPGARRLVTCLLERDPASRLGSARGTREIMEHEFFASVDWIKVAKRAYEPLFVPLRASGTGGEDEVWPGLCNFDPENWTQTLSAPVAADYQPGSRDEFEGFEFDMFDAA
jgi:serum/glucocorticoid-regulated kinase 2